MDSVSLIYNYPDGHKKYWRGIVDHRRSEVVLEYSAGARAPRQTVIGKAWISKATLELELEWRAEKKLREGYVHLHAELHDPDGHETIQSSMRAQAGIDAVMELVPADENDPGWFF
ncbi:hypothetical protein T35B1_11567 [Salinisphaera shabanensis T35B1]|uniref:hypothetical protein n=1 Tax=Salinisphaera TaxID=180541 RepID=UPI003340A5FF